MTIATTDQETVFLGHRFRPVSLDNATLLEDYLRRYPQRVSGYSFASLAAWAEPFGLMWARVGPECLLLSRTVGQLGERQLLQPIGQPSGACCASLVSEAEQLPYRMKINYVTQDYIENNADFCTQFDADEDRGSANYIYLAKDLADLPGGRYGKKRNLISQFLTQYPRWEAAPLDMHCGDLCREVLLSVAHGDGNKFEDASLREELQALDFTMAHFDALRQCGLLISVDGKPVAFSIYERQNLDTAVIHFEKAHRAFKGVYQVVNRETARMIVADGYHLINREEDLDQPGLRQAKLSYYPLQVYPVFNLSLKIKKAVISQDGTNVYSSGQARHV